MAYSIYLCKRACNGMYISVVFNAVVPNPVPITMFTHNHIYNIKV